MCTKSFATAWGAVPEPAGGDNDALPDAIIG